MPTVLITGANRGIGLALATAYAARGDRVWGTSRREAPELAAAGATVLPLDLGAEGSLAALDRALGDEPLDLLVCNAGVLSRETLDDLDVDRIRHQLEVNALAPLRCVAALRHRLGRGAKVGIVTSRMGSIADNTSGGMYGYRMSKAAVNMAGRSLAHDLAPAGVSVLLVHPGYVRTGMTGHSGHIDADEAAAGIVARLDALTPATSGAFVHQNGEALPW